MLLGAHMSIAGGVDKAVLRGQSVACETIQIFTKSNQQWRAKPLEADEVARFQAARAASGIAPVFAHAAYLINLATPDDDAWEKSLEGFIVEVERCALLKLPFIVLHPGAHGGAGEEAGLSRVTRALDECFNRTGDTAVMVLLEITAGQGSSVGGTFEHLAGIMEHSLYPERLGICFDTCHAFAAGYDLRTPEGYNETIESLDRLIGLERLKAIHLNDAKGDLGSHLDRHTHIGLGKLGLEAFRLLLNDPRLQHLPMVLETPKGPDLKEDVMNLSTLRSLVREQ
ncbi:MAG: deoxyribonuclease IV [Thermacetogeniaceae bacterium]